MAQIMARYKPTDRMPVQSRHIQLKDPIHPIIAENRNVYHVVYDGCNTELVKAMNSYQSHLSDGGEFMEIKPAPN